MVEAPPAGDGSEEAEGEAAGEDAGGGVDGDGGATTGLLGPGAEEPVAVAPVLGRAAPLAEGRAAVDALPDGAALPDAPGAVLAPGLPGIVPDAVAVAPEPPGTVPPGMPWRGLADLPGVDVPSTWSAAGFSSAWPGTGTGSQGAPAFPESSAATMTTA
ncbi:hypothetical protein [Streptomyces sp. 303MFCol5.2]|uniref:hypothetical protein n=1 Tax=Streptomyces sp. 303MFCol5.2 TaxID=1172181 RepID=UPI00131F1725|nr:hypothetical protein [Streptomyces sp. 303MFCol5.2]